MGIIEIVAQVFKLSVLILSEVFEAKKRARLANETYEVTKARLADIAEKCISKLRDEAAKDHQDAIDVEDQLEKELGKK